MEQNNKIQPSTLEGKVDAILRILQGEPIDPTDDGLMGEVKKMKARLFKIENWKDKTVAWAIGVSFGGGALTAFVAAVIFKK
jgi:hypothetical protein